MYQILMNLNSLVTKAISKGGILSHLFCQTALTMDPFEEDVHFQLLDELIKKNRSFESNYHYAPENIVES